MIRAICFDFGDVLAGFSHERACEQIAALTGGSRTAAEVRGWLFGSGRHVQLEEGKLAPADFLAGLKQEFRIAAPAAVVADAYSNIFTRNEDVCRLIPRLARLRPLLLGSNTDPLHWEQMTRQFGEEFRQFRHCLRSYQIGVRKPGRSFFERLVRYADCPAAECLFIDDLRENVEAARQIGMQGLVYRTGDDLSRKLAARGITIRQAN
jgi:glucose-1-phosphatase